LQAFDKGPNGEPLQQGRSGIVRPASFEEVEMVPLIALVLILAIFGGLGFAVHVLWFVLIVAVLLWLIGFFIGGVPTGGSRRGWYGR
jgi:1,4-dihydroxy-2-naphthoate octaprenyltransferase